VKRPAGSLAFAALGALLLGTACRGACPDGCGRGLRDAPPLVPPTGPGPGPAPGTFGGDRPARVFAGGGAARGVLLALHGYGDTGTGFARALGLPELARREGLVLVSPDGTLDRRGHRFWNATDACCNFSDHPVDDVAYLRALLAEVAAAHHVEPGRRYVLGLSNGTFMAHRLACEAADELAAIVPIAGTTWDDPARCRPTSPVSVLQVHGDADRVILYEGGRRVLGRGRGSYPGSVATVERWASLNGCSGARSIVLPALDLDHAPGAEATVEQVAGCPAGVDVRLLAMRGAPHVPAFRPAFGEWVMRWLAAHPKPPRVGAGGSPAVSPRPAADAAD